MRMIRSTLNADLILTGVAELIDDTGNRYPPDELPLYVPVFGQLTIGGGKNPLLQTFPDFFLAGK